jgi:N-acetyl-anhydromuramoyl-L-alanine amidase
MEIEEHRLCGAEQIVCPNADARPDAEVSLIVIHNISLPLGHFGSQYVKDLFCSKLDTSVHEDFADLEGLRVSSHLLIHRDGSVSQFVPFNKRAWHAGESAFMGRRACNDFSVGIELEGTDSSFFRDVQYQVLAEVCRLLISHYDVPEENIVGHSDIAPGRKTDPGPLFCWDRFRKMQGTV